MKRVRLQDDVEVERRRRIRVAAWAYAYEVDNDPVVDDATYDAEAEKIDVAVSTGNAKLDAFFREHYKSYTGSWVHIHPGRDALPRICEIMRKKN
jgi:hypothetical protein